ncbi:TolC family protein [Hydrogenophaga sp.]|uniref:TolC family protein n=1 Tax=Hydrogenophaga sp. TaxID=1904254 RepID=UPI003F70F703
MWHRGIWPRRGGRQLKRTNEAKAAEGLRLRYPALPLRAAPLPDPTSFEAGDTAWRERMVAEHPLMLAATQNLRMTELRAERTPNPTVGVFMASEARRTERIVGVSFSIPLGGTYRQAAALEALRQVDVARAGLEVQRRELDLQVAAQLQDVVGSVERWRLAEQAATALRETARLSQRAYTAGELDVQALLLVRRQALSAATAAQDARASALRARYRLLLGAGALWPQVPL